MALKKNQYHIEPNHLYMIYQLSSTIAFDQSRPNIFVQGTVDVYGSNSEDVPQSLSDMSLPKINRKIKGFATFEVIPTYIYCKGESTEIVLTGIRPVKDYGALGE